EGWSGGVMEQGKNNWNWGGRLAQRGNNRRAVGEEHVRSQRYQFRYIGLYAVRIASGKTIVDLDVATLHPTKVPKPFAKCRDAGLSFQIILGNSQQHTNPPHPLTLLRARRERPCSRCAAEQRGLEFSSCDVACHVTLRLGVIHAMEG